jgi:hypothetical protein
VSAWRNTTSTNTPASAYEPSTPSSSTFKPICCPRSTRVVLVPTEIVAIRRSLLGPPVTSLAKEYFAITAALDLMLTGI